MARGGSRHGAGRRKGVPNKATARREALVAAGGETPLDYLLSVMRDAKRSGTERLDAAKAAAPYVHARFAPVDKDTGKTAAFVINLQGDDARL